MTAPNERLALSAALLACLLACAPLLSAAQGAPDDLAPRTDGTDGNGTDPLPTAPPITSVCNPDSLTGTDPPEPCTKEQEAAALADLAADMPSSQDVLAAVFDTSTCDPADPGGYTEAVDLSDPTLLLVIYDVAHAYVAAQGNDSFWAASCSGDYTQDAFNACRVPNSLAAAAADPATDGGGPAEGPLEEGQQEEDGALSVAFYKIQFKVSCSQMVNDTVAVEALATLESIGSFNQTVTDLEWKEIALPGVGQRR